MKQETNNEMDLLLRRLSRGQGAATPDGELRDHLDADELSSYAENVLPAAARARYTEHLAECSRCRELVVQLSSAAGVVVAEEPSRVAAPSGLRKFLASLFSPMVLRYAVPALGLIAVAVIGLTVFRNGPLNSSPEMVATTNRPTETPAVAQEAKPQAGFLDKQDNSGSPAATPGLRGQRKEVESPASNATPAAKTAGDIKIDGADKAQSQPVTTAAAPPAAAAPKPAETTDEVRKREPEAEKQKQEEQVRAAATPQANREGRFQNAETATTDSVSAARRAAKNKPLTTAEPKAGAGAAVSQSLGDKDKDRADAETRTVGGRRFRKQRSVWVDTAFSGGATMDLPRGSERYRSVVADEPQIKTIAEQLDGQIIVVWKGRAYRIQ